MKIGDRMIDRVDQPYIIAEVGVNHDGDARRALSMVDAAADAGADAVKLQFFKAELLMSAASRPALYQAAAGEHDPIAMLQRLELSAHELARVCDRIHNRGMHGIVTVFSVDLVHLAREMSIDAFKTASPDIVHRPLLEALCATGFPLIISTGAATIGEVERAVGWVRSANRNLALLQCVSAYPTPIEHAALDGIAALRQGFPELVIGYSDHTSEIETGARAVERGAVILEKHFTWNSEAAGPDHAASLDPAGFARYVALARAARPVTHAQSGQKQVLDIELDVRNVSRQSIITARSIKAGAIITPGDVTFKRPGAGLEPWRMDEVVGRSAVRDIERDQLIMPGDIA